MIRSTVINTSYGHGLDDDDDMEENLFQQLEPVVCDDRSHSHGGIGVV